MPGTLYIPIAYIDYIILMIIIERQKETHSHPSAPHTRQIALCIRATRAHSKMSCVRVQPLEMPHRMQAAAYIWLNNIEYYNGGVVVYVRNCEEGRRHHSYIYI